MEPTQHPIQWVLGVLSPGVKRGRGVMPTTHPYLVPRLIVSRSYTSSPPCASMTHSGTAFLLLLRLWTLSIVWYSEKKNNVSKTESVSVLSCMEGGEGHLLGWVPQILNHWTN
jgi:hypothetical protein